MTNWHPRRHVTKRLRLRNYDYSTPGAYFVTICTEHRACVFGEIADEVMELSPAGVVVESRWHSIPQRFPGVMVDDMVVVVMPNHLHGIIITGFEQQLKAGESLPKLSTIIQWFKGLTTND